MDILPTTPIAIQTRSTRSSPITPTTPTTPIVVTQTPPLSQQQQQQQSVPPPPPRRKPTRVRRKGQVKLRFHHQALPQEYLDHLETQQQQQLIKNTNNNIKTMLEMQNSKMLDEQDSNNSVRNWLQKISELQDDEISLSLVKNEPELHHDSFIPSTSGSLSKRSVQQIPSLPLQQQISQQLSTAPSSSSRVYNYSDLPYMGEMTLENSKPRRGRKPKKADICHLIYKNYGQIFPGTPKHMKGNLNSNNNSISNNFLPEKPQQQLPPQQASVITTTIEDNKKSELQNKIISSLLEKRLTQNSNNNSTIPTSTKDQQKLLGLPGSTGGTSPSRRILNGTIIDISVSPNGSSMSSPPPPTSQPPQSPLTPTPTTTRVKGDEPLNLCLRDYGSNKRDKRATKPILKNLESLIETSKHNQLSSLASFNIETDPLLINTSSSKSKSRTPTTITTCDSSDISMSECNDTPETPTDGYVYWSGAGSGGVAGGPATSTANSGVFIHPMSMYYSKQGSSGSNVDNLISSKPTPSNSTSISHGLVKSVIIPPMALNKNKPTKLLIAKDISELVNKRDKNQTPLIIGGPPSSSSPSSSNTSNKANSETSSTISSKTTASSQNGAAPQKRKRSAIFIPPMPSENSTNPTTEVSICKFKFTGGAKPSLQEKKMLSVDSGGNFRYYSGTGDKSMRGYEFFPRESLQQSSLIAGSSSGAFLSTPGEKITTSIDEIYPSMDLTNDILQLPNFSATPPLTPTPSITPTHQLQHNDILIPTISMGNGLESKGNNHSSGSGSVAAIGSGAHSGGVGSNSGGITTRSSSSLLDRKKRKSRRSLQREKLEKTFKEKGFLIQTQQLESAEGATYCKFRQLTKFTRYLFRSWKDYLPGDLQQQQQLEQQLQLQQQHHQQVAINDGNGSVLSSLPQPPSPSSMLPLISSQCISSSELGVQTKSEK